MCDSQKNKVDNISISFVFVFTGLSIIIDNYAASIVLILQTGKLRPTQVKKFVEYYTTAPNIMLFTLPIRKEKNLLKD